MIQVVQFLILYQLLILTSFQVKIIYVIGIIKKKYDDIKNKMVKLKYRIMLITEK